MSASLRSVQVRLGARILRMRNARGQTQDVLARACGISQKYLSELERGEKAPSFETLVALAHDGFGCRVAALVFAIDEDEPVDVERLDEVLAGRPAVARANVLRAMQLLLDAGAA